MHQQSQQRPPGNTFTEQQDLPGQCLRTHLCLQLLRHCLKVQVQPALLRTRPGQQETNHDSWSDPVTMNDCNAKVCSPLGSTTSCMSEGMFRVCMLRSHLWGRVSSSTLTIAARSSLPSTTKPRRSTCAQPSASGAMQVHACNFKHDSKNCNTQECEHVLHFAPCSDLTDCYKPFELC